VKSFFELRESLRKDIASMSRQYPEGERVIDTRSGRAGKVLQVGRDFVIIGFGDIVKQVPAKYVRLKESVELDETKINQLTRVGWMDGDVLNVEDDDISTLQRDLKSKGYTKSSGVKKGLETHMVYTSKGKPDIFLSYDGQNDAAYVSYNKRSVFESVELEEAKIEVGDRVRVKDDAKKVVDRGLLGKSGVVVPNPMGGRSIRVKFVDGRSAMFNKNDLEVNESVELDEASWNKTEKLPLTPAEKKIIGDTGVYKEKYKLDRTQSMYRASKTSYSMPFTGTEDLNKLKKLVSKLSESVELGEAYKTFEEARKDAAADLYFNTYSAAIQKAINDTFKKHKLEVDAEDYYQKVNMGPGKPGRGKTTRHTLDLVDIKTGKPSRKKLHIQVYNRETAKNPYELNFYVS
jgi:hypothetical protein